MLLPPFAILRHGEPIEAIPLRNSVTTGIQFGDAMSALGIVPEFEQREAAAHALIPWPEWENYPHPEQGAVIAHYRLRHLIGLHTSDAVSRESERKSKARKANR